VCQGIKPAFTNRLIVSCPPRPLFGFITQRSRLDLAETDVSELTTH
jgi:hypothetical protein